jgi:hypothetical protein
MSDTPVFANGQRIVRWFASLPPLQRLEWITRVEQRHAHYYGLVLAAKAVRAPRVTEVAEAKRILGLELFYSALLPLLEAEHLLRRSAALSYAERTTLEQYKAKVREELLYLQPLMQEGFWAPLKQRWRTRIHTVEAKRPHIDATDPIERLEQRLNAGRARSAEVFDTARALSLVELVPDRGEPVDPLALDPDPLIRT